VKVYESCISSRLIRSFHYLAPDLPELEIEPGFLPKLKERIRIAKEIEKAQHQVKKVNHERSWIKEVAEAMDVDIDPDVL